MATIFKRKSDNVVTYCFTNLVDINNITFDSNQCTYTLNNGASSYVDANCNTSTHDRVDDVTAPTSFWGNCFTYDTEWEILTDVVAQINSARQSIRDATGDPYPEVLEVEL